jgi:hypothetical protein
MLIDTSALLRSLQLRHPQYAAATRALELLPQRGRELHIVAQNRQRAIPKRLRISSVLHHAVSDRLEVAGGAAVKRRWGSKTRYNWTERDRQAGPMATACSLAVRYSIRLLGPNFSNDAAF